MNYYVYMLSNNSNSTVYTGVTNDLVRRVYEHKSGSGSKFTKRYHVHKLVYYEVFNDPESAISREKAIKNLVRRKKNLLVRSLNPSWSDLSEEILSSR